MKGRETNASIGTLLIRADASAAIGTGHVMRCLALAQAWQDVGGVAVFAMAQTTESVRARLASESCEVVNVGNPAADLRQTIDLAQSRNCEWVVIDGYQFDSDYQLGVKSAGLKVLFLDDYGHSQHYAADLILNQNLSASPTIYSNRQRHTRLLLGPRYATLRREFSPWTSWERMPRLNCHRLLVMMGGGDQANVTAKVLDALCKARIDELDITVLVGGSNPHLAELQVLAASSGLRLQLLRDISNIGEIMAAADIAISAAGSTCWELCLLGLPSLLIDVAANQSAVAKALHDKGCAIHIGDHTVSAETVAGSLRWLAENHKLRQSLAQRSRDLVDGKGAARVVSILRGASTLRLRPAQGEEDRRLLWEWANDPEVRAASFSPGPISWETHCAWFDAKLRAQNVGSQSAIFIAEDDEQVPLGQIRFDRRPDGDWEVAISLGRCARGRGLACEVIRIGVREILRSESSMIHAFVKSTNEASLRAFERADFTGAGAHQLGGNAAIHLIYKGD